MIYIVCMIVFFVREIYLVCFYFISFCREKVYDKVVGDIIYIGWVFFLLYVYIEVIIRILNV